MTASREFREFATELRKLAYTMPGGHEDPLLQLSERIARHAQLIDIAGSPDQLSPPNAALVRAETGEATKGLTGDGLRPQRVDHA